MDISQIPIPLKLRFIQYFRQMQSAPSAIGGEVGRETPQEFIVQVLGEKPTEVALRYGYTVPWTPDQEQIMDSVLLNRKTAVHSGKGIGKTAALARIALWFLYRRPNSLVITTAPNKRQVEELLWGEIRSVWKASKIPLPGRLLMTSIVLADKWKCTGFTANSETGDLNTTAFAGFHAPQVLVIVDEATATDQLLVPAIEGICIGPDDRIVAIGNPTNLGCWFYRACHEWESVLRVSCANHPNVIHDDPGIIPGAVSRFWINDHVKDWGEDSPLFKALVEGLWPQQSEESLIQIGWLERAKALYETYLERGRPEELLKRGAVAALDVASEGEDLTVLSVLNGGVWEIPIIDGHPTWHVGRDTMAAVDLVMRLFNSGMPIRILCSDDTALGKGVAARLRQLQREGKIPMFRVDGLDSMQRTLIYPINFAANAWDNDKFENIKDELWWMAHEMLRDGQIAIPTEKDQAKWMLPRGNSIEGQLITSIYTQDAKGRVVVYDKRVRGLHAEDTKNLPQKSPDVAHSMIMCCWAWKKLETRGYIAEPETEDVNEWWTQQIRKMIIKGSKREKPPARKNPWQKTFS